MSKPKLSVMAQIRTAFARRNWLATAIGAVKGGSIPFGTFVLYHLEMANDPWQPKGVLVLCGLIYSIRTVYGWCQQVFRQEDGSPDTWKALGWCLLIEGLMTISSTFWINCGALALLVLINAIATGISLTMEDETLRTEAEATPATVTATMTMTTPPMPTAAAPSDAIISPVEAPASTGEILRDTADKPRRRRAKKRSPKSPAQNIARISAELN